MLYDVGEQITMARIIKLIDVHYCRNMGFIRFAYFAVRHAISVMCNKGTRVRAISHNGETIYVHFHIHPNPRIQF